MGIGMLDAARGYLDKWEMYKALRSEQIGPCRLPVTTLYSAQSLTSMFKKFKALYVKPVDTWGGNLISYLSYEAGSYLWAMPQHQVRSYQNLFDLSADMSAAYENHLCIVQQAAPLAQYQHRPFDIRVHMQREHDGSWTYGGDLVRVGGTNATVSNVGISGGKVLSVEDALSLILPREKSIRVQRKLEKIGYSIVQLIEQYRYFNEVGIDLGIEKYGQLWLLEVNTDDALGEPSHELFAQHPDQTIYQALRQRSDRRRMEMANSLLEAFFSV